MEIVKFQQAILINSDLDMYYAPTDTPALCRTSSLVEELGQIEYIFSDKTGVSLNFRTFITVVMQWLMFMPNTQTLTQNVMIFRECSIAGVRYADSVDETRKGEILEFTDLKLNTANPEMGSVIVEFLTLLATCHTVIPERKGDKITYQASSPDEGALVQGAEMLDYRFTTRKPTTIYVDVEGKSQEFVILNICEFNSTRKRMSAIVRGPDGRIKLYCKGADTVIVERLAENNPYTEVTLAHLEVSKTR
jgi:phospholipid-transporting ATPase